MLKKLPKITIIWIIQSKKIRNHLIKSRLKLQRGKTTKSLQNILDQKHLKFKTYPAIPNPIQFFEGLTVLAIGFESI